MTETMAVVLIASLMAMLSTSMASQFVRQNRVSMQANELIADLSLARTQAAASGKFVSVCTSATGTACAAGNWQDGYMVFVDTDGDGVYESAAPNNDRLIRVTAALSGQNTLTTTGLATANRVQYRPDGLLADVAMGSNPRLEFRITANGMASCYREVWVDTSGRPYSPTSAQLGAKSRAAPQC